jgi:lipopolysaccharide transport system permease protein
MFSALRAVWNFRGFIATSIRTEFSNRFARSRLGALWMIIFPLVQTALFALVLSGVISPSFPQGDRRGGYGLFLLAGMLSWAIFVEIVTRCQTVFIDNSSLLKKLAFPRMCLPIIVCGSAVITNVMLLLATLLIFAILGHLPGINALWFPLVAAINIGFALGLGLTLGILNVFVRDIGHMVGIGLQMAFWLTPIVYLPSALPEPYRWLLKFNPMAYVVEGYQNVLVFNSPPPWPLFIIAGITILLLAVALRLFRRASPEMVDVL